MYKLVLGIVIATSFLMCPVYAEWAKMYLPEPLQWVLIVSGTLWVGRSTEQCFKEWRLALLMVPTSMLIVLGLSVYTYGYEEYLNLSSLLDLLGTWLALVVLAIGGTGGLLLMTDSVHQMMLQYLHRDELREIQEHLRKEGIHR